MGISQFASTVYGTIRLFKLESFHPSFATKEIIEASKVPKGILVSLEKFTMAPRMNTYRYNLSKSEDTPVLSDKGN